MSARACRGSMRHVSRESNGAINRCLGQMAALLALLLSVAAAAGQRNGAILKADIPFPFVVADRTLPAGRYALSTLGDQILRIADSRQEGTFVLTYKVRGNGPQKSKELVFNRYHDRYFLTQVWGPINGIGRQLHKCHAEVELEGKGAEKQIAVLRAEK